MSAEARARTWPIGLRRSRIPITIVCGPPGSGKTTYAREHAGADDIIIDLDEIKAELAGAAMYSAEARWTGPALMKRNTLLRSLAMPSPPYTAAWFIVSAPEPLERRWWQERLGGKVHIMDVDEAECIRRINADHRRIGHRERMIARVADWFARARGEVRGFDPPGGTAHPLAT